VGGEYRTLSGDGYVTDTLGGVTFRISAPAFYQVNSGCTELLYNKVDEYAGIAPGDTVADLYCGVGTIGMYLARRHPDARFVGVEIVPEAIADAKANAVANGLTNVEYFCGDAGTFDRKADVAVVDPPRKGLSRPMLNALLRLKPRRVVYVSCGPDTLARDLKTLTKEYRVETIQPVDMFPMTEHCECVVRLSRSH
jgi:23S rRNA (uracil1939-C5)-methyltransferase